MKAILVLMVIALAALIGVNLHFQRELEAGRQQIGVLTSQAHESQAATVASPVKTPAQTPAQPPPVADQVSQQVASPDNPVRRVPPRPSTASVLAQLQTPEWQARSQARSRARIRLALEESALPDIEQVLDLTTAEKDKLLDLLATQPRGVTTLAPENEGAQESEERYQRLYNTRVAELQALLGSKYPRWQDYIDTVSVRREVRDLRVALDAAGLALAQTQERALVDALVEVQRGFNLTDRTPTGVVVRRTPENIQLLVSAAAPYLSMQQLDEYQALLERRREIIEAAQAL